MSATLDVRLYSDYLGGAPAVAVAGRSYPVEILYTTEGQTDYVQAAVTAVLQIHADEAPGDILAFLTGQDDIEAAVSAIEARARALPASAGAILPLPLYAALPPARQLDALRPAPPGTRGVSERSDRGGSSTQSGRFPADFQSEPRPPPRGGSSAAAATAAPSCLGQKN